MCDTCGCAITPGNSRPHIHTANFSLKTQDSQVVDVLSHLLEQNNAQAAHNRAHLDAHGTLAINIMSAPGAGKTTLLEATVQALSDRYSIAVIEGDLETENDAARIRQHGIPAVQITTGTACHLDAHLVHEGLHGIDLSKVDLLFVENVGNLVCPATFDLGQHFNVTLLSVTEGDDKAAKYPVIFRNSDLILISKADLLGAVDDFDPLLATQTIRKLGVDVPVLSISARAPHAIAIDPWLLWLQSHLQATNRRGPTLSRV